MAKEKFDYEKFAKEAQAGLQAKQPLLGKDGVFTPLLKQFLEAALEGELESHLKENSQLGEKPNRRNGRSRKQVQSPMGGFELVSPRDRNSSFEPEIVGKREVRITSDIDQRILSMYSMGMSYADIRRHLLELYDFSVSEGTLSSITDQILPAIKEWQNRPLESVYPVIWLDAMHYKVRDEGVVRTKAVYSVLGVSREGEKDVLGVYLGDPESATFWRGVLSNLRERGVEDVFIACIDNLKGLGDAIDDYFPMTAVQLCLVHQMRNSIRHVADKDAREVARDLKRTYQALTEPLGLEALAEAEAKWGAKYPAIFRSWRANWERLAHLYGFKPPLRRLMYTTNPIESYHRMIRKVTKTKGAFNSEKAIIKLVYLAVQNAQTRWKGNIFNWSAIHHELENKFENRMRPDTVR
jgi:putative transposase